MGLKIVVDKLDDVDSKYHDLYTERDGKFHLTGVDGMKTQDDIDRLQTALTKERNDHKGLKDRVKLLGDRKIEDVVKDLDRIPELEAAAKGAANVDELVEAKIKARIAPVERERDKLAEEVSEKDAKIVEFEAKDRTRKIHDSVREAIGRQQGFQSSAVEDALLIAERLFEVDDRGQVVARDGVGVTPGIAPQVWLQEVQQTRPHWWGPNVGGGAGGNAGGKSGTTNPWTNEHWNMTEQGRILRENPQLAEQMAKSANTTIGGGRPPASK